MRLLLDNGLPRSAAAILVDQGIDAVHVGDVDLAKADDATILAYAIKETRVVVTLDADFHTQLALRGARAPSVIRIRVEGLKGAALAKLVSRVFSCFNDELTAGAAISVGPTTARCHLLPF